VASLEGKPIVFYTLIATTVLFLFSRSKNVSAPQIKLLAAMLFVIMLSSIKNGWAGGMLEYGQKFASAALLPFILFSSLTTTVNKHKLLMFVSVAAAVVMVHNGIFQTLSADGLGWVGSHLSQGTRITYLGIFNDPNDLGMFLVMCLPMAGYFYTQKSMFLRLFAVAAVALLLYGTYLTNSRGTLLGVVFVSVLWLVDRYGVKKASFIVFPALLPVLLWALGHFRNIDPSEESAAGRVDAWYAGYQMLMHSPFVGVGMSNFEEHHELTAHNSYILVMAELGLIGYFAWLSFIVLTFLMLFKVRKNYRDVENNEHLDINDNANGVIDKSKNQKGEMAVSVEEEVMLAKAMTYSLAAFCVTAFFLSRTYTPLLYIFAGLAVSGYYRCNTVAPNIGAVKISGNAVLLLSLTAGTVLLYFLLLKILL
jgi:O-antigen ligase